MTTGAVHRIIPSFFIGRIIRETFLTVSLNLRDPYDFQFKQCATLQQGSDWTRTSHGGYLAHSVHQGADSQPVPRQDRHHRSVSEYREGRCTRCLAAGPEQDFGSWKSHADQDRLSGDAMPHRRGLRQTLASGRDTTSHEWTVVTDRLVSAASAEGRETPSPRRAHRRHLTIET